MLDARHEDGNALLTALTLALSRKRERGSLLTALSLALSRKRERGALTLALSRKRERGSLLTALTTALSRPRERETGSYTSVVAASSRAANLRCAAARRVGMCSVGHIPACGL